MNGWAQKCYRSLSLGSWYGICKYLKTSSSENTGRGVPSNTFTPFYNEREQTCSGQEHHRPLEQNWTATLKAVWIVEQLQHATLQLLLLQDCFKHRAISTEQRLLQSNITFFTCSVNNISKWWSSDAAKTENGQRKNNPQKIAYVELLLQHCEPRED